MRELIDFYRADAARQKLSRVQASDKHWNDLRTFEREARSTQRDLIARIDELQAQYGGGKLMYFAEFYVYGVLMYDFSTSDRTLIDHWYDHRRMEHPDGLMTLTEQRSRRI